MDYLAPKMSHAEVNPISVLGLAHIGDGVYELMTRTMLCRKGHTAIGELHKRTVAIVKAPAQAKAAAKLLPLLTEEEAAIYRRGRNAHVHGVPQGADVGEYHAATGLETLFGTLYLLGRQERLNALYAAIMED